MLVPRFFAGFVSLDSYNMRLRLLVPQFMAGFVAPTFVMTSIKHQVAQIWPEIAAPTLNKNKVFLKGGQETLTHLALCMGP